MSDRMMRATAAIALLALCGCGGAGRKAAQEALEAAARNAAKQSDEAAVHAMTAEEAAQLGLRGAAELGVHAGRVSAYKQLREEFEEERLEKDGFFGRPSTANGSLLRKVPSRSERLEKVTALCRKSGMSLRECERRLSISGLTNGH